GGTIRALKDSGLLDFLEKRGIEMLSYFQVDNLIVPPLDELFIGIHSSTKSDVSSRMLAKTGPHEKLGNFCVSRKRLHIIEYSDMPEELALQRDDEGRLRFISGSPAIHVFSLKFLKRLCNPRSSIKLPWHRADKKVPFIDGNGKFIRPDTSNAVKLETFIFDSLPLAKRTIILEGIRNEQFSPTKNPDGVDSVQSARAMLSERDASWLEAAGIPVPKTKDGKPDCILELSPMEYYDLEDVIQKKSQIAAPKKGEKKYYG
nr:UTP--glucose-1-phosphate uridylyltransferase [Victivallales bacterium]